MEHHQESSERSSRRCPERAPELTGPRLPPGGAALLEATAGLFSPEPRQRSRHPPWSSVGVLGGGTAGYLAALALRRKLPDLAVTVIESSRIPVIGVGEASTPLLPAFLHGTLGLDLADFFRRARPTLKLGIRFDWGRPGGSFLYPFDRGRLVESLAYEGDINHYSLASLAMAAGKGPVVLAAEGEDHLFLPSPFAYHVDNRRLAAYLRQEAEAVGVCVLDRTVTEVETRADQEGVRAVSTEEGERLAFDFWIDASGFGSRLLGRALGVEEVSFRSSLFTDTALIGTAPQVPGEPLPPYTTATTRDHGWSWRIPQRGEDHVGYVYSSAHATPETAEAELRAAVPGLGELRTLRFAAGRRRQMWRGNVAALGNSYGFVEPLESTSLHMVVIALVTLLKHVPQAGSEGPSDEEPCARETVNRWISAYWNQLRAFLALHFKYNHARDTPFWRSCREDTDLAGAEKTVDLFRERAPLSSRPHLLAFDSLWGDFGRDVILLGQGVPAHTVSPTLSQDRWRRILQAGHRLVDCALPHDEALNLFDRQPEILRDFQKTAPWLQDGAVGGRESW